MTLQIVIAKAAAKELRQLDRSTQARMIQALERLQRDPRPRGAKKLKGEDGLLRLRVGDFRVIYHVYEERVIIVLLIKNRKHAYDTHTLQSLEARLDRTVADNVVSLKRPPGRRPSGSE
ncbi:type II toxin-antitoxin system RelE/ParE family toxin [Hyphomonadaceae bacterium ML37]|nr:type II toxin-antitoxin system RelE/ParE family toxin [Hyphomonadaceae bacterium ML37]